MFPKLDSLRTRNTLTRCCKEAKHNILTWFCWHSWYTWTSLRNYVMYDGHDSSDTHAYNYSVGPTSYWFGGNNETDCMLLQYLPAFWLVYSHSLPFLFLLEDNLLSFTSAMSSPKMVKNPGRRWFRLPMVDVAIKQVLLDMITSCQPIGLHLKATQCSYIWHTLPLAAPAAPFTLLTANSSLHWVFNHYFMVEKLPSVALKQSTSRLQDWWMMLEWLSHSLRLVGTHAPWWLVVQLISSSHSCGKTPPHLLKSFKMLVIIKSTSSSWSYQAQSRVICCRAEHSDCPSPLNNFLVIIALFLLAFWHFFRLQIRIMQYQHNVLFSMTVPLRHVVWDWVASHFDSTRRGCENSTLV